MAIINGGIINGNSGGGSAKGTLKGKQSGTPFVQVTIGDSEVSGSAGGPASENILPSSLVKDWQSPSYKNGGDATGVYVDEFSLVADNPQRTTPTLGGGVNFVGCYGNNRGNIARGCAREIANYYRQKVYMLSIGQPAITYDYFAEDAAGDIEIRNHLPSFLEATGQEKVDLLNVVMGVNSAALNRPYDVSLDHFLTLLARAEVVGYYTPGYTKVNLFGHTNDVGAGYWAGQQYIYERTGPDVSIVPESDLPTIASGDVHHSAEVLEIIGGRAARSFIADTMSKINGGAGAQSTDWYAEGEGEATLYSAFGRAGQGFTGEVMLYGRTDTSDEVYSGKYIFHIGSGPSAANPYLSLELVSETGDLTDPLSLTWLSGIPAFGPVFKVIGSSGDNWSWWANCRFLTIPDQTA